MTNFPWVLVAVGTLFLIACRVIDPTSSSPEFAAARLFSEVIAALSGLYAATLPWQARRLEEATRLKIQRAPTRRPADCKQVTAIDASLSLAARLDLSWAASKLLSLTNVDGLVIWHPGYGPSGAVVCARGIMKTLPGFSKGVLAAISARWKPELVSGHCLTKQGLARFPAGVLPSAILPGDAESVLVRPLPGGGLMVLWSAQSRVFDRTSERLWATQCAAKLGVALNGLEAAREATSRGTSPEICFEDGDPVAVDAQAAADEGSRDPFARFGPQIRVAPVIAGLSLILTLFLNRFHLMSQDSFLALDTAQARVDIVAAVFSASLVMQSVIWISETPQSPVKQDVTTWEFVEKASGVDEEAVGHAAASELLWAWDTLSKCTCACSMVVFWNDQVVMQGGLFRRAMGGGVPPYMGELCQEVMSTKKSRYLAELRVWPAREQVVTFLPAKTQGLLLTPLQPGRDAKSKGLLMLGLDTPRGVGKVDQAWIAALGEKLAVTLQESTAAAL